MGRLDDLLERYRRHIELPWARGLAGAQRVVFVVYDPPLERRLRARRLEFANVTRAAGHEWREVDVTDAFAEWMAAFDYRESYFQRPEALSLALANQFPDHVANSVREALRAPACGESSVVAVFGVAGLYGLTPLSGVLKRVASDIPGRLVVFFPGSYETNVYRLLDGPVDWNYLAVPITASEGEVLP